MRKKMSVILAIILSLSLSVPAFAEDISQMEEALDKQEITETQDKGDVLDEEDIPKDELDELAESEGAEEASEEVTDSKLVEESENRTSEIKEPESSEDFLGTETIPEEEGIEERPKIRSKELSVWTAEDFTYTTLTQTLNGCDYTRQFQIKGPAIAGFSKSGEEKLKWNKDLVIPSANDKGEMLVGVAARAFKEKGIESVEFPEGMMVDYDDTVTHVVTRRGNFIIDTEAFAKNKLTSVNLPEGVIAVMSAAFRSNQLKKVSLPHTIWWIENSSFAYNELTTVGFPKTCDFQVQIHAFAFSENQIRTVRLPDYTEVVQKHAFILNPGVEACPADAPEDEKTKGGIVYMYTDNAKLANMERIHHIGRSAESQHSWHQKLVVGSRPVEEGEWSIDDFTVDGTTITGLSESGIKKRKLNKELILPDKNKAGQYITELADTDSITGLFTTEEEKFTGVVLPVAIERIGNRAFMESGLTGNIKFPSTLKEVGLAAFQNNSLTSVVLPDSVTTLGGGAFGTNPKLNTVVLSKNLKEIAPGAFGSSDKSHWMENLTQLVIPEGITKIGNNAFAGNNIKKIEIPSTVTEIGEYAFSTKNYLKDECTVILPEGLKSIGKMAFRNKVIKEVELPSTVNGLSRDTFLKEYSDGSPAPVTTVYINKAQYKDKSNFPSSDYHVYKIKADPNDTEWDEFDFTYATWKDAQVSEAELTMYSVKDPANKVVLEPYLVTGLSELGALKMEKNKDMVIPKEDPDGKAVTGIAPGAFDDSGDKKKYGIESVKFPENVKAPHDSSTKSRDSALTERGDFIICSNAFSGNQLTMLKLPEGVIRIGEKAFEGNQIISVTVPQTTWWISDRAFAVNRIVSVDLPQDSDFKMNIGSESFAGNKIRAVQLPNRIERVEVDAFKDNSGMEEVDSSAPGEWKDSGVVHMYAVPGTEAEDYIGHIGNAGDNQSYIQKLITDKPMPDELKPWGLDDFVFSADGGMVTGLSDRGKVKMVSNPNIVLPDRGADGKAITALGDADTGSCGLFGSVEYKLESVYFPESLERIGNNAFRDCGLESIRFPKTLTAIGEYAFAKNNLTKIILPDHVTEVGTGAFSLNSNLERVKISKGMTTIPVSFAENSGTADGKILELVIYEGITSIGDNAFKGSRLSNIELPASVKTIGSYAFAQVQGKGIPVKIVLSEGLEAISKCAFEYAGVTELNLPSTLTALDNDAFKDCVSGGKVKLYTSNPEHVAKFNTSKYHEVVFKYLLGSGWSEDDFTYNGTAVTGWSEKGNKTRLENKKLKIPDRNPETGEVITEIGESAFKIPDDEVNQLKDSVESPNGMTEVVIPETVTKIGEKAFEYNSLENVDFPKTLKEIGGSSFHGNKLKEAIIPGGVSSIGSGAFSENNITKIVFPPNLTKLEAGVFSMNIRLEQINLPERLTEIGAMAFAGARLTSLTIPKSVSKIGRKAFHLHHLKELTIPGNVKEIGESAFEGTFKAITLEKLVLEEGVETIGDRAFKEGYLKSVNIPNSLKSLASNAFENNSGTNNDHIVVCYTKNKEHLKWPKASTYRIVLKEDEGVTPPPVVPQPQKVRVNKIKLTGISKKIAAGKKITLKATVYPANASNKKVTWKSSNTKVATVSSKGVVTMKKKSGGKKVKITAIAADGSGVKATYMITAMKGVVKKVTISGKKTVKAGKSLKLKAKVTASRKANKKVTWTSSNTKYAKVSASGKVKTYKAGKGKKVKITVKATDGSGKKKTVTIKIK